MLEKHFLKTIIVLTFVSFVVFTPELLIPDHILALGIVYLSAAVLCSFGIELVDKMRDVE